MRGYTTICSGVIELPVAILYPKVDHHYSQPRING